VHASANAGPFVAPPAVISLIGKLAQARNNVGELASRAVRPLRCQELPFCRAVGSNRSVTATMITAPIISPGRFCSLGPLGIVTNLKQAFAEAYARRGAPT